MLTREVKQLTSLLIEFYCLQTMAMKKKWLVILSQQRSGSTALRLTLSKSQYFHSFGEVFHSLCTSNDSAAAEKQYISISNSYFLFKATACKSNMTLLMPQRENQETLFHGYLDHLQASSDKDILSLDVKYNSWHHFDPTWHDIGSQPLFARLLLQRNIRFLHLIRADRIAQACSQYVASRTQVWHRNPQLDQQRAKIKVPLQWVQHFVKKTAYEENLFRKWLDRGDNYLEVRYESLFQGNTLKSNVVSEINELLKVDLGPLGDVPILKLNAAIDEYVENVAELYANIQD